MIQEQVLEKEFASKIHEKIDGVRLLKVMVEDVFGFVTNYEVKLHQKYKSN